LSVVANLLRGIEFQASRMRVCGGVFRGSVGAVADGRVVSSL